MFDYVMLVAFVRAFFVFVHKTSGVEEDEMQKIYYGEKRSIGKELVQYEERGGNEERERRKYMKLSRK